MTDAIEKTQLNDRTRARNSSLWVALDWGGLMTPLAAQQAVLNSLGQPGIENYMAITEETWSIKESQRDRTYELDQAYIGTQQKIADDEIFTRRETLAIQKVTDAYTLAVLVYKATVQALLMGAREYAAQVELEQLGVEKSRAILAVSKEVLHQQQVNASIFLEYINGLMVDADIAKAKVEVAKAQVRAVLADIQAGEADIKVIMAQIEQYMAEAEKATLQADVAMIFAEILTKKLSAVKLDIGQKEIAAGFGYIQSRFDDAITKLATQKVEEGLQLDYANEALAEANLIFPDEKISENLREQEQLNAREVFNYTETATYQNILDETALRALAVNAKEALSDQRLAVTEARDIKQTWAQALVNAAHQYVYKNRLESQEIVASSVETISG